MSIYDYKGVLPRIPEDCFIADSAAVIGDVSIGGGSSVWFGAVLRGDVSYIAIGENTNIQDNCVVHVDDDVPTVIGSNVTVGHNAIIHAATVEDDCLIGMGAIVLDFAHIGRGSIIAAGAVVPPHAEIPPFSQVAGVPGKVVKTLDPETAEKRRSHAANYAALSKDYIK